MRIRISKENDEILYKINGLYNFKTEGVAPRIAFSYSITSGKKFQLDELSISSDGRDFRDDRGLFGSIINDVSNVTIFKAILDQTYNRNTSTEEFIKLFKQHLNHGLEIWNKEIDSSNISKGEHIGIVLKLIKQGLSQRTNIIKIGGNSTSYNSMKEFTSPLTFLLGELEDGTSVEIKINDLNEFDNRNIAIAGMAGSGKTQLIKDILYQISKNTNHELKFIFFDYKGEGNPNQLESFLSSTKCEFVDIVKNGGLNFNPFLSIDVDERQRPFSIKAFVDTVAMFVPSVGVAQKNILNNIISNLFEEKKGSYPHIEELRLKIEQHYEETNRKADTLFAGVQDLSTNIFNCSSSESLLEKNVYLNLPPTLSDTLRQLIVFLLLRYFYTFFSSTNDCEPNDNIMPLRYIIVIDEAHIYLKNKNARKALEELLRLLRSKGVIIIMLSQGVEDYKTKDFDFASQVQLPICLNIQNKDYKSISSFIGTPNSKIKLESEIRKLESGKGLININEPKTIRLRQFWKTIKDNN